MNPALTPTLLASARVALREAVDAPRYDPSPALDLFLRWTLLEPEPWHEPNWGRAWDQVQAARRYTYAHERITRSLDQASAFAEAVLPGFNVSVFSDCGAYFARVEVHEDEWVYIPGMNGAGYDERALWPAILLDAVCGGCDHLLRRQEGTHERR